MATTMIRNYVRQHLMKAMRERESKRENGVEKEKRRREWVEWRKEGR